MFNQIKNMTMSEDTCICEVHTPNRIYNIFIENRDFFSYFYYKNGNSKNFFMKEKEIIDFKDYIMTNLDDILFNLFLIEISEEIEELEEREEPSNYDMILMHRDYIKSKRDLRKKQKQDKDLAFA